MHVYHHDVPKIYVVLIAFLLLYYSLSKKKKKQENNSLQCKILASNDMLYIY